MPEGLTGVERCVEIMARARSVVVSTGAGISKESGIPTFRDAPSALWAQYDPEQLATPQGFRRDPPLVWRWYAARREMIAQARPNAGHHAIADIETLYDDFVLVTQNIDDLHRKAGSRHMIELHGNIFRYKCFDRHHPIDTLPEDDHTPPRCHCGSLIRPDVVWFGEMLSEDSLRRSFAALATCDVLLVVGTSGVVQPAAGFPWVARDAGANVVEVNPESTPVTDIADVFIAAPAGEALPAIAAGIETALNE